MTNPFEDNNLTLDKLRQLIIAAKKHVQQSQTQVDAAEYNWRQPHHFSPEHLEALEGFGGKIAERLGETFAVFCPAQFDVTITSIGQHFSCTLAETISAEQDNHYFLPFESAEGKDCGFISIAPETAATLVSHMLRDSESGVEKDRKLSQLEESILIDITTALVEAFTAAFKAYGGGAIKTTSRFVKGDWPVNFGGLEDLCSISFTIGHPDGAVEATFIITSAAVEPVLGIRNSRVELSAAKISKLIMRQVHWATVEVVAQLCSESICLHDLMNLGEGDILLLGKKTNESIGVLLNGRPSLRGYPVSSSGKYALVMATSNTE